VSQTGGPTVTTPSADPPAPRQAPASILVAEDEEVAALAIRRGLEVYGYRILGPALTGADAVRLAEAEHPDLAVLDINMPLMDGLTAADHIQMKLGVPAVILSAYTDAEYLDRARRIGVSGYLVKPVRSEELAVAIDLALTRFRQLQTLAERVAALEQNLVDRKVIERAKGVLMRSKGISEEEAYLRIQRTSRRTHRKMVDVARSVLEAQDLI
jgi:response regulator NasT